MSRITRFITTQWHDIKGNAKWDFIKLGAIGIIALITAIIRFVQHAPLWQVLIALIVTCACVCFLISAIQKFKREWPPLQDESLKPDSDLEIEGIPIDITTPQKHLCQIRIRNKNLTKTADNVQVDLIELADSLGKEEGQYFRPSFPVILIPAISGSNTINPGGNAAYDLFQVTMNVKSAIIKDGTVIGWQQKFIAYFTQETTKNVTLFFWKKDYRLKLVATARDFLKVEQIFNLTFSDGGAFCRFTLTKITNGVPAGAG